MERYGNWIVRYRILTITESLLWCDEPKKPHFIKCGGKPPDFISLMERAPASMAEDIGSIPI